MSVDAGALLARLGAVQGRLSAACAKAGREPSSVKLLAVSKRHSAEAIRVLYEAGQRDFGENYAQELVEKAEALSDLSDLRWHFIGAFQRNKVGMLAPRVSAVHTLAGVKAGQALGRRVVEAGRAPVSAMLQVNAGREPQKAGLSPEEAPAAIEALAEIPGLRLVGLMTIPPASNPDAARACYQQLASLAGQHGLPELSMGMSGDLALAVECGATWVRIGTDLFGQRSSPATP